MDVIEVAERPVAKAFIHGSDENGPRELNRAAPAAGRAGLNAAFAASRGILPLDPPDRATRGRVNATVQAARATTRVMGQRGDPPQAIAAAAKAERVDLLVAGVLDHKGAEPPTFLGAVARPLAEQAPCSVLLLSQPQVDPRPFRRIVVV